MKNFLSSGFLCIVVLALTGCAVGPEQYNLVQQGYTGTGVVQSRQTITYGNGVIQQNRSIPYTYIENPNTVYYSDTNIVQPPIVYPNTYQNYNNNNRHNNKYNNNYYAPNKRNYLGPTFNRPYVAPNTRAPGAGYEWRQHQRYGYGWFHSKRGWQLGWK